MLLRASCTKPTWPLAPIKLEITESLLLEHSNAVADNLNQLGEMGMSV